MLKYADSKEQNISESKIRKILSTVPHDRGFNFFTGMDRNTGETAPHNKHSPHILRREPTSRFEPKCLTFSHFEKKGTVGDISTRAGVQIHHCHD